jgi:hypothetical protein
LSFILLLLVLIESVLITGFATRILTAHNLFTSYMSVSCRATVVEDHELWYKDDERLNLELCEDEQRSESDQPDLDFPCCACDDALYEVLVSCIINLFMLIVNRLKLNSTGKAILDYQHIRQIRNQN